MSNEIPSPADVARQIRETEIRREVYREHSWVGQVADGNERVAAARAEVEARIAAEFGEAVVPGKSDRIARRYHAHSGALTHALDVAPRPVLLGGVTLGVVTLRGTVEGIVEDTAEIELSVEQTLAVAAALVRALGEDFESLVQHIGQYRDAVAEGTL